MESLKLKRTGREMPLIGFGLWQVPRSICAEVVYEAIKAGYRLLDGAGDYGNEKEAGEGVRRALDEGLVKREDLFITSKLWNTFHAREHVKPIAKRQLKDWGLDYFDLYLMHFPVALQYVDPDHRYPGEWRGDDQKVHLQNTPIHETWVAMEELVDEGLTKNLGISNFQGSMIIDLLRYARIEPAVLQVEIHPYLTQEPLLNLANILGLAVTAYSSFGPQSWLDLGIGHNIPGLLSHDVVAAIARDHNKTTAQVLLRWATQKKLAVVPKSNSVERLKENLQCNTFTISEANMRLLDALNMNIRLNNPANIDPRLEIFA